MVAARRGRILPSALALLIAATGISCSALRAPLSPPEAAPQDRFRLSVSGIQIEALPVRTWEQSWELFDDNLPAIGILPVWIEARDSSSEGLDLTRAKWELRRGTEHFHPIGVDQLFKQYYRRHQTRFYSLNADRTARAAMAKILLPARRLPPSEVETGYLFFRAGSPQSANWTRGAVLEIRGIQSESRKRRSLELPLSHAHP